MSTIENVSDTARWVAVYRAMESARRDALFHDPYAARLAGERGAAIVDGMKRGRTMAWAMIVRTAVFDEIILDRVRRHGVDRVVNLAAGLDARAWRLPLPPTLRWIDVDLPGMTAYKQGAMRGERPACAHEALAADLADAAERRALFERLRDAAPTSTTLVVSEGLLIYLTPDAVAALARDLHDVLGARWWLFDLASPALLAMINRDWGKSVRAAPFRFGPAEGTAFFEPHGWREAAYRSQVEEARRLRREMRLMWLWRLLGRFASAERKAQMRRFSGFVLLERT